MKLVVKNIGNNSALNINIIVEPEVNNPFSHINFLAPAKEISNIIKYVTHSDSTNNEQTKYIFNISYEDPFKEKYSHEYEVDISPLLNATNFKENENKAVVNKLDKMLSKLDDLKGEISKLNDHSKQRTNSIKELTKKIK
jgi:peptidoglycan hydrolase CwlO-like protein